MIIRGQGFCPGSTVYFGNDHAAATTQGPFTDGLGPFGDETAIRTAVPSLATSGDVFVVRQGASLVSSGTATAPFTIDDYRDVNGFSFDNCDQFQSRVGGYSFSDVSDVFGDEQTHISVNPCWPFGDCSITTPVPDPFALLFWGIADAALQDGQCFGFSLASQRLLHGDQIFPAFPRQAGTSQETVWNLQGPESSGGASDQLAHYIHLMHMEQFSREALSFWLAKATTNAVNGSQSSLLNDVTSALDAGDHPLVEMRNGSEGHVVVAYEVDQANGSSLVGPGDRVIDVYNPNAPFTAAENSTDGTTHEGTLSTSEIVVHPDGHWEFQGFSPEYHGGPGSLVVMPYGVVPVHPDLPIDVSGLISLMFGSATATQVTDGAGPHPAEPRRQHRHEPRHWDPGRHPVRHAVRHRQAGTGHLPVWPQRELHHHGAGQWQWPVSRCDVLQRHGGVADGRGEFEGARPDLRTGRGQRPAVRPDQRRLRRPAGSDGATGGPRRPAVTADRDDRDHGAHQRSDRHDV